MDARNLRIGIVGLGYWGPNLVRNLADAPAFDVSYLCDVRAKPLETLARRYPGVLPTSRFEDMLEDDTLDAVAIATPVSTHFSLAMAALEAGKHVFVEKPLAASSEQVGKLTDVAEEKGLVLMPGHTFLYSPAVTTIKRLIDSGELGEIYFISSSRVNLGLHQPDVSVVWDLGPHDFSILRYWLDGLPAEVSAVSRSCLLPDVPDVAFINLRYPSGTVAHVELSWLAPSKLRRTAIVGSEKMVVYDDTSNEPVRIFDSGAKIPDPETFGEYQLSYRRATSSRRGSRQPSRSRSSSQISRSRSWKGAPLHRRQRSGSTSSARSKPSTVPSTRAGSPWVWREEGSTLFPRACGLESHPSGLRRQPKLNPFRRKENLWEPPSSEEDQRG